MEVLTNIQTQTVDQKSFNLNVEGRYITVCPCFDNGRMFYRVLENGVFIFILNMNAYGFWEADDEESDPVGEMIPINHVFAQSVGEAIEQVTF